MDEALLRFPHLGQQIFESLDPDSLERSLVVSKSWKKFISNQKFPWIRLICNKKTQKDLLKLLKKMTVMKLRKMAIPFKRRSSRLCSRKSSCLKYAQYSSNVLVNNFKKYNYLQPQVRLFCNQLHWILKIICFDYSKQIVIKVADLELYGIVLFEIWYRDWSLFE